MKGRKFQCTINGATSTLWHGFDKTQGEQLLARRTMHVFASCRDFFVDHGLCEREAPIEWLKTNLIDLDSEVGVVYIKVATAPEAIKTTHDVSRRDGNNLTARRLSIEAVKTALTTAKGEPAATKFGEVFTKAIADANEFTARREDGD